MAIGETRGTRIWGVLLATVTGCTVFVHLALLSPGVDAGLHMYGSYLLTRGFLPYRHFWNNKPFLIYVLGLPGFLCRGNPFLGVRFLELIAYALNLFLFYRLARSAGIKNVIPHLLSFAVLYLVSWDQGFLTETFTIPLTLLAAWGLVSRRRYLEWWGGFLLVAAFLLKQNGGMVIGCIILIDVFSAYRGYAPVRKLIAYGCSILVAVGLAGGLVYGLGIARDYLDQVFIYNSEYVTRPGLFQWLTIQLKGNSFVSYRGISAIMLLNAAALWIAIRYIASEFRFWTGKGEGRLRGSKELVVALSALVYLLCYYGAYVSGKTYAHYFLLLIVPAAFLAGDLFVRFWVAKLAIVGMLAYGVFSNFGAIHQDRRIRKDREEVAAYIDSATTPADCIHLAGFGNQYVYVMAGRMSNTRFLMPLIEDSGYSQQYRQILQDDFTLHPPFFILFNNNSYRSLDPDNFYTKMISTLVWDHYKYKMENGLLQVYQRQPILPAH